MNEAKRVLFIGSKTLGLSCIKEMYALAGDRLAGALTFDDTFDSRSALPELIEFCTIKCIPLHIAGSRDESERIILREMPDLCIVCGWYWLISNHVLSSVSKGFLGVHNSLLPKYRGGSPLIWSILNGEKEVGFSMFSFTEGMDDGPIWFQSSIELTLQDDVQSVLEKLESNLISEFRNSYLNILSGKLKPTPQSHSIATYCGQRQAIDGEINWKNPAIQVYNFIRAQTKPYPGAYTFYKDKKLTIWKAQPVEQTYYGIPGQVVRVLNDGILIVCGNNQPLLITAVEYEGKQLSASELIRSISVRLPYPSGAKQKKEMLPNNI